MIEGSDPEFLNSGAKEFKHSTEIAHSYFQFKQLFTVENSTVYPCLLIVLVALFLSTLILPDLNEYISRAPVEVREVSYLNMLLSALIAVAMHILLCLLYLSGGKGKDRIGGFKIWSFIAFLVAAFIWIFLVNMFDTETKYSMKQVQAQSCMHFDNTSEEVEESIQMKCLVLNNALSNSVNESDQPESISFNFRAPADDFKNWAYFYDLALSFGICLFITIGLVILTYHVSGSIPDRSYNNILFPVITTFFFFLAASLTYNEADELSNPTITRLIIYAALGNLFVFGIQIISRSSSSIFKWVIRSAFFSITPKDTVLHGLLRFVSETEYLATGDCRQLKQQEVSDITNLLSDISMEMELMAHSFKDSFYSPDVSGTYTRLQLSRAQTYERFALDLVQAPETKQLASNIKFALHDIACLSRGQYAYNPKTDQKNQTIEHIEEQSGSEMHNKFMSVITPIGVIVGLILTIFFSATEMPKQFQDLFDDVVRIYFADNNLIALAGIVWFATSVIMRLDPKLSSVLASAEKSRKWFPKRN